MDEKEKQPEKQEIQSNTETDTNQGIQHEEPEIIKRTNALAERIEKANEKHEELVRREEDILARKALGGVTSGRVEPEKPKPMSDRDYADKFRRGEIAMSDFLP